MNYLGNILINGKMINLNDASIEDLKSLLVDLNGTEENVKKELDDIITELS